MAKDAQRGWWQRMFGEGKPAEAAPALPAPDAPLPPVDLVPRQLTVLETERFAAPEGEGADWLVASRRAEAPDRWQLHLIQLRPNDNPLGSMRGQRLRHVRSLRADIAFPDAVRELASFEELRRAEGLTVAPGGDAAALGRRHIRAGLRQEGMVLDAGGRPVALATPDAAPVAGTFVEEELESLLREAAAQREGSSAVLPREGERLAWHSALFDKDGRIAKPTGNVEVPENYGDRAERLTALRSVVRMKTGAEQLHVLMHRWQAHKLEPLTQPELNELLLHHLSDYNANWSERTALTLLALGADPDIQVNSQPAIAQAAGSQRWDIASLLIDYGADPDPLGLRNRPNRPVLRALEQRDAEALALLLAAGAEPPDLATPAQERALQLVIQRPDLLLMLSERGLDLSDVTIRNENVLRHIALQGSMGALTALMAGPTRLDMADAEGMSVLAACVNFGRTEQALRLIASGAALDCPARDAAALLDQAIDLGNDAVATALLETRPALAHALVEGRPILLAAAERDLAHTARTALRLGADVDARGPDARTPLLAAVQTSSLTMIDLLRRQGADADARDGQGRSLADIVVTGTDAAMFLYLYDHGGDTPAEIAAMRARLDAAMVKHFGSPMGWAVSTGNPLLVEALLQAGHDANATVPVTRADGSRVDIPALCKAVESGNIAITGLLAAAPGIRIDAPDETGASPLILATRRGRLQQMRRLLDAGADTAATDASGFNALSFAWRAQAPDVARLLLDYGAEPTVTTAAGDTFLLRLRGVPSGERIVLEALRGSALEGLIEPGTPPAEVNVAPTVGMLSLQESYALARQRRAALKKASPAG